MANKDHCGSFGADLLLEGTIAVPKLLLHNYTRLGLKDSELVLLLELIGMREMNPYPVPHDLAGLMGIEAAQVENMLGRLIEESFLAVEKVFYQGQRVAAYSFTGLMDKLAEIWAQDKARAMQEQRQVKESGHRTGLSETVSMLIKAFETEFGRPLTQIECSNIAEWERMLPQELILEALKRAVFNHTTNWRYINSILAQWDKKNLRTLQAVYDDDAKFQASRQMQQAGIGKKKSRKPWGTQEDKYKDLYL